MDDFVLKSFATLFCFTVMNEVKQSKCLYVLYNPSLPAYKILGCVFEAGL